MAEEMLMTVRKNRQYLLAAISAALPALAAIPALADNGTWNQASGGTWADGTTAPWLNGIVADGSGFTANFSTQDITSATTIALGAPRTIGNLTFADTTTATAASWVLSNGGNAANILTLDGATPSISVSALGSGATTTISAVIAGTNGLTKLGAGTLVLTATNTYTGGTTINGGRLTISNASALGNGAVTIVSGGLGLQNSINFSNTLNLNGGAALLANGGNNIISGTTNVISNSTVTVANTTGSITLGGTINLGNNTLSFTTVGGSMAVTISGVLNGSSSSSLSLGAAGSTQALTSDNSGTFFGAVGLNGGTNVVSASGAFGTGGTVTFGRNDAGATLRSNSTAARTFNNVFALTGTGNSTFTLGSTTASVNGDLTFTSTVTTGGMGNSSTTRNITIYNRTSIANGLTGSGAGISLAAASTGTFVLGGNNSYTGPTTINGGTLLLNGANTGNGLVAVNSPGRLGGTGSTTSSVTVNGGGLTPGDGGIGTFTVGGLTMTSGTLQIDVDTTGNSADKLIVSNNPTLNSSPSLVFSFGGFVGAYNQTFTLLQNNGAGAISGTFAGGTSFDNGQGLAYTLNYAGGDGNDLTVTFSSVPEPGSLSLIGLAALGMLKRRRRK
jgi:autotransporter-associated beta strand protein